jgi:hypothetical protein
MAIGFSLTKLRFVVKLVELYERIIQEKEEKLMLLEQLLKEKSLIMKRFFLLVIGVFFTITTVSAQEVVSNSDRGYYIKDGKVKSGIFFEKANRKERSERLITPAQLSHQATTLYASDIEEYGFSGQQRYLSAEITIHGNPRKVFLEEVANLDSIIIYCYPAAGEDLFFLQKGNELPQHITDRVAI